MLEVERVSNEPIETNIDPRLQEEELTFETIEELVEIQVEPMSEAESSRSTDALVASFIDFVHRN